MDLVSFSKIDDLLVGLDKKKCPWCDGNSWALRGIPETDTSSTENLMGLRGLPHFRLYKEQSRLKGTMTVGTENALPLVVARCNECGFVYLFDYFHLVDLYHRKQENAEKGNGASTTSD